MLITQSGSWEAGQRKKTIKSEFTLGPVSLKFVTIALLATAALFYLAQSTQASSLKYKVMDLEDKKAQAQTDVNQLEVESARLQSLSEIKNSASGMNLVPSK
jgi:cell division protein FtsL